MSILRTLTLAAASLVAMLAISACATRPPAASEGVAILKGADGAALLRQCSRPTPEGVGGAWIPDWGLIAEFEAQLPEAIASNPRLVEIKGRPLDGWIRQYTGIERGGQRYVYLSAAPKNARATTGLDWRNEAINVCHGGADYFGKGAQPAS